MDTNALMMPVELDVRVFDELERLVGAPVARPGPGDDGPDEVDAPADGSLDLVAPRAVVDELETLSRGSGEEGVAASVGADLVERCRVVETEASYADDAVVELASTSAADYVVTNDAPLRDRLLERGVRVIGLRGRNELKIIEP